ncbi:MAG: hypothetical protein WD035_05235 [Balneolaceae bacterium]
MNIFNQKTCTTFLVSLIMAMGFAFTATTSTLAQESDYQVQQNFRAEFNDMVNRIDNAITSKDLEEILAGIEEFEAEYSGYSELINHAIYPETFESRLYDLNSRFRAAEQNIATIEQLNERIRELSAELDAFRSRLEEMDSLAGELREEIQASESNEQRLSGLVRQYRENLQQRDRFVTGFLESLITRYETIDSESAAELSEAAERMDENPMDLVQTILGEYINHTDQTSGLQAIDYLRMKTQHVYFSEVWSEIGENLAEIFASDRQVQARQEVEDLLSKWNTSIENKLWNSMTTAFNQNNISLGDFNSGNGLFDALTAYIESATAGSREVNTEEDYETYRNFTGFWNNTVKSEWGDHLVNGEVLTFSQMSAVDEQLQDWNEAAVPTSNLMLILFLISIAVIIGLVVMLVRKK